MPAKDWAWRVPLGFQIIPAAILGVAAYFFPSSPRWLIARNREVVALNVLTKIRSGSVSDIQAELNAMKREITLENEKEVQSCLPLTDKSFVRRLILGTSIQIFSQLTGINSIMYYAPEIFNQTALVNHEDPLLLTGIAGCVNILATIPAVIFIDKFGRRFLLMAGSITMALSMITIGGLMKGYGDRIFSTTTGNFYINIRDGLVSHVILIAVYIFVFGFAFSYGPINWVYCSEIFPLTKRATGTSIAVAANWTTNFAVSFLVPVLLNKIWFGVYIMFGVFCLIMGILTFLFYPETKDVPLERMDKLFSGPIIVYSHPNKLATLIDSLDDGQT